MSNFLSLSKVASSSYRAVLAQQPGAWVVVWIRPQDHWSLVASGVWAAVNVAIGLQRVLGAAHHVGCFNIGLHEDNDVVDLNTGHGAEGIDIGKTPTDLHADSEVHLSLVEGLYVDDIVQLLSANDSLHVEHLAAYAVHKHREEIGVAEV